MAGDLLGPFSLGYVKGWRRALGALICVEGVRCLCIDPNDLPAVVKAIFWGVSGVEVWSWHANKYDPISLRFERCPTLKTTPLGIHSSCAGVFKGISHCALQTFSKIEITIYSCVEWAGLGAHVSLGMRGIFWLKMFVPYPPTHWVPWWGHLPGGL